MLPNDHPIYVWIARLIPWRLHKVQVSRKPKANRWLFADAAVHRAAVLLHDINTIVFDVVKLTEIKGSRERFTKPVKFGVFCHGVAPGVQVDPSSANAPPPRKI